MGATDGMLPTIVIEEESGKTRSVDVTNNSATSLRKGNDWVMFDRQDKTRQDKTHNPFPGKGQNHMEVTTHSDSPAVNLSSASDRTGRQKNVIMFGDACQILVAEHEKCIIWQVLTAL